MLSIFACASVSLCLSLFLSLHRPICKLAFRLCGEAVYTPTNNSGRSCPRSHENSQTSPHNPCPKITLLAKNPSTHPLQNNICYLQYSSNLLHSPTSHHPTTRVYSLIIISFLVSSSLKFCNRSFAYAAPTLWNDSQKTSVSLHILLTHLLISPILRSHSPLLHSTHD